MAAICQSSGVLRRNAIHYLPTHYCKHIGCYRPLTIRKYSSWNTRELPEDELDEKTAGGDKVQSLIKITDVPAPHTGHIRVITLDSPHNKNAISRRLLSELRNQVLRGHGETEFEKYSFEEKRPGAAMGRGTRAIVIGSEVDGVFCAGADLKERKTMTEHEYVQYIFGVELYTDLSFCSDLLP